MNDTAPNPEHGGYAWTEWLARETENHPMPDTTRPTCPDGGSCHHQCAEKCFRVNTCEPLSGVFPGDTWPESIHAQHAHDTTAAAEPEPTALTVQAVEAHVRSLNGGELPTCSACEQGPVLIRETDLPSDTPTGRVVNLLGKVVHVRRAVIMVCSREEDCTAQGIEITGLPEPTPAPPTVHRAPIGDATTTPCCDRSSLELMALPHDRITLDNARVTCAPMPTVVYHWASRMLPLKPVNAQLDYWEQDHLPRPDPTDSYDCALRDIHDEGESIGIGWQDPVDPVSDRERWEFVPYYVISYPTAKPGGRVFTKPLRVCETCAGQLTAVAPFLSAEADTAKLTDRYAFDSPTADALDALYYLAYGEDPATREPINLASLTEDERVNLGQYAQTMVCTPIMTSRAVLLRRLPHLDPAEFDRQVHRVHVEAYSLIHNGAHGHDLIHALDNLNCLLTIGTNGTTGSPRTEPRA